MIDLGDSLLVELGESLDFFINLLLFLVFLTLFDESLSSKFLSLGLNIDLGDNLSFGFSLFVLFLLLLLSLILVIDVSDHPLLLFLGAVRLQDLTDLHLLLLIKGKICLSNGIGRFFDSFSSVGGSVAG